MIGSAPLSCVLTGAFIAIAVYYAQRCLGPRVRGPRLLRTERVSAAAHAVMSVGMISMLWWWGTSLPWLPQILVYGLAVVWFVVLAVRRPEGACCGRVDARAVRMYHAHHAVLMAGMVWMVAIMALAPAAHESSMGDAAVPAMDHSVGQPMDHAGTSGAMDGGVTVVMAHEEMSRPQVASAVSVAFAAYFLLLTPWWLAELVGLTRRLSRIRPAPRRPRVGTRRAIAVEASVHAVKCAGMGAMLVAMR